MFSMMQSAATVVAFSLLLLPASARTLLLPEDTDALAEARPLILRDKAACPSDPTLSQCGDVFPANFCCPSGTICLPLNTTASVVAAICCPEGNDCALVNTVSCERNAQNATLAPGSYLHSEPTQQLDICGGACCPMGYACQNGQCITKTAASTSGAASSPTASQTSAAGGAASKGGGSRPLGDPDKDKSDFSGKSFAAGFIPGIVIGAFLAAFILFLCCFRKRRRDSNSSIHEKQRHRDTLTDLGTLNRRPTMHGRNISEPRVDSCAFHRTDFLRVTPPRAANPAGTNVNGYSVDVRSPAAATVWPASSPSPPKIKALFSRSPFMSQTPATPVAAQPPVPAHLKRGTLSFKISPVRALKKQKSSHSLRRQMTDASRSHEHSRRTSRKRQKPDLSRSESTETIQVLMPSNEPYTPDRPAKIPEELPTLGTAIYQPPKSASTWNSSSSKSDDTPGLRQQAPAQTPYASSSRYPSEMEPYTTPTRPPIPRVPNTHMGARWLHSPYTPNFPAGAIPSKGGSGGLAPPPSARKRDTTFSAMMAQAGLRKSDLLMGTGNRKT